MWLQKMFVKHDIGQVQQVRQHTNIGDRRLLKLGNTLRSILQHVDTKIQIPEMVTVGTQSSGKTSVINGIISMDILPTGKLITTRTPLRLQLIQTAPDSNTGNIEFGEYLEGIWSVQWNLNLSLPLPTKHQIELIRKRVLLETVKRAGQGADISDEEISVRLYSPYTPNLTLIDLPGLTFHACTDRGQPLNIKHKIEALIQKYIEKTESIVIGIFPAREDIEADACFELIKRFDPTGKRTIGVLTKVDLMEKQTDISNYLLGHNISNDLKLNHGYYAVRNRSSNQMNTMDNIQGIQEETKYFATHNVYGRKEFSKRVSIPCLSQTLSAVLFKNLELSIPKLKNEIRDLYTQVKQKLTFLGSPPPRDHHGAAINSHVLSFVQTYSDYLDKRGATNIGSKLKKTFIQFRTELSNLSPFDKKSLDTTQLKTLLDESHGNHMHSGTFPIELFETFLSGKTPFDLFHKPADVCMNKIKGLLINLVDVVIDITPIHRFPKLKELVLQVTEKIIIANMGNCWKQIVNIINFERSYIWTDDDKFQMLLVGIAQPLTVTQKIRLMLKTYFTCISENMQHILPKAVMNCLVKSTQDMLSQALLEAIHHYNQNPDQSENNLLEERATIADKREVLKVRHTQLKMARKLLASFSSI